MKSWQERVILEHRELMIKIDALAHFLVTADVPDKDLLELQHAQMLEYATTLHQRIQRFNK